MSAEERSGWRDAWISARHRGWGKDCPMIDVDTVWIEYDNHRPKLLVEYKSTVAGRVENANHACLLNLAEMAGLPALGVRYWEAAEAWMAEFQVTALNARARQVFDGVKVRMSEEEYVALLYRFRGRDVPAAIVEAASKARWLRRPMVEPWESMSYEAFCAAEA